jgi:8-oxo-dGTP pyrophosphatase MutT (NUDIX family)
MNFPVSIKGVLVEAGRVVLLENERDEWELPGGRLEPGEAPETCLVREFAEELGAVVEVARIIDCGCTRFCLNARSSSSSTV